MKYTAEEIGKKIKDERLKINWSQEALGKDLGQKSGAKQISKYENGLLPPLDVLLKLCEIFNCELGYLLGEEDYSSGTKVNTAIEKSLGLNTSSVNAIKHITGSERNCVYWGHESQNLQHALNKFISAPSFAGLIISLSELDSSIATKQQIWLDLEEKYGKETFDKAKSYYYSTTDYIQNVNAEKLEDIYYQAMDDIDSANNKSYDNSFKIKVLRYEAREAFERLLDDLYPQ